MKLGTNEPLTRLGKDCFSDFICVVGPNPAYPKNFPSSAFFAILEMSSYFAPSYKVEVLRFSVYKFCTNDLSYSWSFYISVSYSRDVPFGSKVVNLDCDVFLLPFES